MNSWQRWIKAPQTHLARRILFQIHLWLGIGLGLYVLAISISGGALLLRSPFYGWFEPKTLEPLDVTPLTGDALNARMAEVYEGYTLGFTIEGYEPTSATYIVLGKDGSYFPHYFNQYTGEDMGVANPWPIKTVEWLANFHDDLLMDRTGRKINGIGGLLFILMSVSGLLIWWQGKTRWHEGLMIRRDSSRKFMWQLHSFIGFWSLLLMLAWGISGFQLGFPQFINTVVNWFDGDLTDFERPDGLLRFFRDVHFARIGQGALVNWTWIVVSFLPSLMFISGVILWWRRVLRGNRNSALAGNKVESETTTALSAQ